MEEDFRTKEPFVSYIHTKLLLGDCIEAFVTFDPFCRVSVVLIEFLYNVRTNITVFFFDGLCCFEALFGRNVYFSFSKKLLDEVCDVSAGNRNMLDATSYHISFSLYNRKKQNKLSKDRHNLLNKFGLGS